MEMNFYGRILKCNGAVLINERNKPLKWVDDSYVRIGKYQIKKEIVLAMYFYNNTNYEKFKKLNIKGILINEQIMVLSRSMFLSLSVTKNNPKILPIEGEIWKKYNDIVFVSNYGRIKNILEKEIFPKEDTNGYLVYNGLEQTKYGTRLNRIVYDIFIGIKDKENVIKHLDNDKKNNMLYNLMEDSTLNNIRDSVSDGLRHQSKIEELTKIVALFNDRLLPSQIKNNYPEITFSLESLAKTRAKKVYSHITEKLGLKDFAERSYLLKSEYEVLLQLINEGKTNKEILQHFNYIPIKLTTIKDLKKRINRERISV